MRQLHLLRFVRGLLLVVLVVACQTIAGIEDRKLDPSAPSPSNDSAECKTYCDTVMDVCTGPNAVYTTRELCLGVCKQLEPGDPLEPVGNTLACRMQEAKGAQREPADHCRFLGPGGGGKCGSDCEAYCDLFPKICATDVVYPTTAACLKACGGLVDEQRFDVLENHGGDTIECRLVHLSSATVKPDEHCKHAPIIPDPEWCSGKLDEPPTCEQYCLTQLAACDGDLLQYENEQQCLDTCAALDLGTNGDQSGDTVGCRRYHAWSATLPQAAQTHCSHSGPTGDGHCGDKSLATSGHTGPCTAYCTLLEAACPEDFAAEMKDADTCMAECIELDEANPDSKYSVPNAKESTGLSCRVLHATRAFADKSACDAALGAAPCK